MKGKRRRLEWVKNLLILLLSLSAIWLLTMTPLVQDSGILDLLEQGQYDEEDATAVTLTAAALPSRMAVYRDGVRSGIQYDQSGVDSLFARLGPLLGEALVSSAQPKSISERRWRQCLQQTGIYFDFTGEVPLSALGGWLHREGTCTLTASARRIFLVEGGGDKVLLCYQDGADGSFYSCETGLSTSLHLEPAISGVSAEEASFAFESDVWAQALQPYTLITENTVRKNYTASIPVTPGGDLTVLLEALDYTGRNHASVSGGDLYLDGNDRLRVLAGGQVIYDAAEGGKYPVASEGDQVTVAEAIEAARVLAESTVGTLCGEAELYLISARAVEGGYQIRFGYRLDGSTVWLYDEGWAAEFYVRGGCVTEFTLYFRSYLSAGSEALLLSMERAAVMLPDLAEEQLELILQYVDRGGALVEPAWVAR